MMDSGERLLPPLLDVKAAGSMTSRPSPIRRPLARLRAVAGTLIRLLWVWPFFLQTTQAANAMAKTPMLAATPKVTAGGRERWSLEFMMSAMESKRRTATTNSLRPTSQRGLATNISDTQGLKTVNLNSDDRPATAITHPRNDDRTLVGNLNQGNRGMNGTVHRRNWAVFARVSD